LGSLPLIKASKWNSEALNTKLDGSWKQHSILWTTAFYIYFYHFSLTWSNPSPILCGYQLDCVISEKSLKIEGVDLISSRLCGVELSQGSTFFTLLISSNLVHVSSKFCWSLFNHEYYPLRGTCGSYLLYKMFRNQWIWTTKKRVKVCSWAP
jgi:hypothetical protein